MANKLPWFTHDHGARNDEFIQQSIDKFGHFGYAAYFMILEMIHEHGTGDILVITQSRLALNLRSRWPQVRLYLDFSRTSGKVDFRLIGTEVHLQIKKFRERQSKLKSNLPSTFRQPSVNLPLEEKEKEIEKKKQPTAAPTAPEVELENVKKPKTGVQKVMCAFKEAKGIDANDAAWDKLNFKRFARAAADVLKVFGDDANAAVLYVLTKGQELDDKGMASWGLEAIARGAATDSRVQEFFIRGEFNGSENVTLDAVGVPGPRRLGGVTRAGEISGDALAGLREQAALSSREQGQLGGPQEDSFDDGSHVP